MANQFSTIGLNYYKNDNQEYFDTSQQQPQQQHQQQQYNTQNYQMLQHQENTDQCRGCMVRNNKQEMIFLFESGRICDVYSKCTSLEVNEVDGLPTHLCADCYRQLIGFNKFRLLCTSSDYCYRQNLSEIKVEPVDDEVNGSTIVKYEKFNNDQSCVVKLENSQVNPIQVVNAEIGEDCEDDLTEKKFNSTDIGDGGSNKNKSMKKKIIKKKKDENVKNKKDENVKNKKGINEDVDDDDDNDHDYKDDDPKNNNDDSDSSDYLPKKPEPIVAKTTKKKDTRVRIRNRKKGHVSTLNLICDICNKKFFKKDRLEAHLRAHQGLKPCVCKICNREFSKSYGLSVHMLRAHSDEKDRQKFECDVEGCKKEFTMKPSLTAHKRKVHYILSTGEVRPPGPPVQYICELCGKIFRFNASLQKHTYTHTGLMPFKCHLCPKKYPTNHKLKVHIMRHEGIKNHICPICGLRKTTQNELKNHINYHTREKLYPCKLCPSIFSNIGNMTNHVRVVHCGIKKYNCTHCDRSFGKAESLKHHVMTHTGEKPHGCSVCGKRFIQSVALQKHMKTHNKFRTDGAGLSGNSASVVAGNNVSNNNMQVSVTAAATVVVNNSIGT